MAPKLGDVVFVNEADPLTDEDVVSPAIVTAVLTERDGGSDTGWWKAVKDRDPVVVTVLRRNGSTDTFITATGETVTDDEGRERWPSGTYSTSADGPAKPVQEQETPAQSGSVVTPPQEQTSNPVTENATGQAQQSSPFTQSEQTPVTPTGSETPVQ